MLDRPSLESVFLRFAADLALRSTCQRTFRDGRPSRVGCVITDLDMNQVVSIGYNGNAHGLHNGCDYPERPGNCGCLHAEDNAMVKADFTRFQEYRLFTTLSPCMACAKRIIQARRIREVFIGELYRDESPVLLLASRGIPVTHLVFDR